MHIVIIGTGNTATVLGRKLKGAGHQIIQVYGRTPFAAMALGAALGADYCSEWSGIKQQADCYIIALTDSALTANNIPLQLNDQLVVHTAGAVSKDVLQRISSNYGVLYPYQSLRKEIEPSPDIPFLIDANTAGAIEQLTMLAHSISAIVNVAGDAERLQYHLCAVITNNFSNFLYTLTADYCNKNGLLFRNLLPLIDETAARLHHAPPRAVQTGPAIRKDNSTIERHVQLLQEAPELKAIYQLFTHAIEEYNWQQSS